MHGIDNFREMLLMHKLIVVLRVCTAWAQSQKQCKSESRNTMRREPCIAHCDAAVTKKGTALSDRDACYKSCVENKGTVSMPPPEREAKAK